MAAPRKQDKKLGIEIKRSQDPAKADRVSLYRNEASRYTRGVNRGKYKNKKVVIGSMAVGPWLTGGPVFFERPSLEEPLRLDNYEKAADNQQGMAHPKTDRKVSLIVYEMDVARVMAAATVLPEGAYGDLAEDEGMKDYVVAQLLAENPSASAKVRKKMGQQAAKLAAKVEYPKESWQALFGDLPWEWTIIRKSSRNAAKGRSRGSSPTRDGLKNLLSTEERKQFMAWLQEQRQGRLNEMAEALSPWALEDAARGYETQAFQLRSTAERLERLKEFEPLED